LNRKAKVQAVKDEDEAIRLDPNIARAHFYRGLAYGRPGNARSDIETAVRLDPSLERYGTAKQESARYRPPLKRSLHYDGTCHPGMNGADVVVGTWLVERI